ncbi:unnamed protein product [Heterobilharzia americana]|nr:unnamed protein product [Heterobilharzia americana]
MRELAELRSRRPLLPVPHENLTSSSLPNRSTLELPSNNDYTTKQEEELSFPSPPPSPPKVLTTENPLADSPPSTSPKNGHLAASETAELCDEDTTVTVMDSHTTICYDTEFSTEINLPDTLIEDEQSSSIPSPSLTHSTKKTIEESTQSTMFSNQTNTHSYYSRPKMGLKRRSSLSESSLDTYLHIPRQKSVTFQKTINSTTTNTTTTDDSENDSNWRDSDCPTSSELSSQYEYLLEQEKHKRDLLEMDSEDNNSELSDILNTLTSNDDNQELTSLSSQDHDDKENDYLSYFAKDDSDLLIKNRISPVLPLSQAARRFQRLAELPKLIQAERAVILQASAALKQCVSILSRKNPEDSNILNEMGPGSIVHVEASRTMLIACQRRQVLMEELALLHRGSPVLLPPPRGDPIRARMKLNAIRLSLKTSNIPNDPTSGGGFVVVGVGRDAGGWNIPTSKSRSGGSQLGQPTCYHLLAVIKCRGEGRLYHSELVTLMHMSDLPVGMYRPAPYVDLPAKLEIVPIRPDFVFQLEIYCMRTGSDRPMSIRAYGSPRISRSTLVHRDADDEVVDYTTPQHKLYHCKPLSSPPSSRKKSRFGHYHHHHQQHQHHDTSNNELTPCETASHVLTHCLPSTYFKTPPYKISDVDQNIYSGRDKIPAFSLISSVEIHYNDDLLIGGRVNPSTQNKSYPSCSTVSVNNNKGDNNTNVSSRLPLRLLHLPRSSPLAGTAGLVDAFVSLEAKVLTRGFMTVFEEISGMGVWQRYWCQLRADYLHFWRYPEDEHSGVSRSNNPLHNAKPLHPPLGRIDLRHVVAPGAVPAPRSICARSNTLYMRSLREIDPNYLSASVSSNTTNNNSSTTGNNKKCTNESLVFRASNDFKWLEQRHLLCADTPEERDAWIMWLNACSESLKDWMPEHFACLSRYDARLEFLNLYHLN